MPAALRSRSDRQAAVTAARPKIDRLWYTRCPVPTVSGIAQHHRWLQRAFHDVGVTLDSIRSSPDRSVRESHFRHSLAGSFREGGNVPPIWARSRGQDTVVLAITWVDEAQWVLVRPDSDITNAGQLRGRRLGLPKSEDAQLVDVARAESLRGLLTALQIADVPRDAVQFVDIPEARWSLSDRDGPLAQRRHPGTEALLAGEVDAIFVKGAGVTVALERGLRPVLDLNEQADPLLRISAGSPRPVTVDRQTLLEAPDLVQLYLAVLQRTSLWAEDHPDDVVRTVAAETQATEEAVRRAFGSVLHRSFTPVLSDLHRRALREQHDWLLAEGFINRGFDVEAWIDPAPLSRANRVALRPGIVGRL